MATIRSNGSFSDFTVDQPAQAIGAMAERAPVDNAAGDMRLLPAVTDDIADSSERNTNDSSSCNEGVVA